MKYLSVLLFVVFFSCKSNQQVKKNTPLKNQDWSVESEKNYQDLNSVAIKIVNTTKNNLVIFDPFLKKIEKFDGENWGKIKIPYCPCGNCPPPPETMSISSNQKHTFIWNKDLVTCNDGKKVTQKMESGRYRVIFNYGKSQNVKYFEKLVVEFEI